MAASDTRTHPGKRTLLIETPPATPSGVNSLFPGKVIMNLRNGITCEVLMGYEWNLVVRTLNLNVEDWSRGYLKLIFGRLGPNCMENPEIYSGKWRSSQPNRWKWECSLKIGGKTCILGTRAEADRDIAFTLQPWSRGFNLKWTW